MSMTESQVEKLIQTEQRSIKNEDDIRELRKIYKCINDMNTNIQLIARESSNTRTDVKELREDVTELKGADGKTFKTIKSQIIALIVSALFGGAIAAIAAVVFAGPA